MITKISYDYAREIAVVTNHDGASLTFKHYAIPRLLAVLQLLIDRGCEIPSETIENKDEQLKAE